MGQLNADLAGGAVLPMPGTLGLTNCDALTS